MSSFVRALFVSVPIIIFCTIGMAQANNKVTYDRAAILAAEDEDKAWATQMYTLFRIVEPGKHGFVKRELDKAPTFQKFKSLIEDWIDQHEDRWAQVTGRVDYCNAAGLGTEIDDLDPDLRWELFILNGEPSSQMQLPTKCSDGSGGCSLWIFAWSSPERPCHTAAVQSEPGKDYPSRLTLTSRENFPSVADMRPEATYSRFPGRSGQSEVWLSAWVPGDQFSQSTLYDHLKLTTKVELYESGQDEPIFRESKDTDLCLLRGTLEAVHPDYRHLIKGRGVYFKFNAKPGTYRARLTASGAKLNDGEKWIKEIVIPKDITISDAVLVQEDHVLGSNIEPGIVRGDELLYDNPELRLRQGSDLNLYVETVLPEKSQCYDVTATLRPLPELPDPNNRHRQPSVEVLQGYLYTNEEGQVFFDKKFRFLSPQDIREIENAYAALFHSGPPTPSETIPIYEERFDVTPDKIQVVAMKIPLNVRNGRYLLTVNISDPEDSGFIRNAWRTINVGSSMPKEGPPNTASQTLGFDFSR